VDRNVKNLKGNFDIAGVEKAIVFDKDSLFILRRNIMVILRKELKYFYQEDQLKRTINVLKQ
jgi:hypothetical protein